MVSLRYILLVVTNMPKKLLSRKCDTIWNKLRKAVACYGWVNSGTAKRSQMAVK